MMPPTHPKSPRQRVTVGRQRGFGHVVFWITSSVIVLVMASGRLGYASHVADRSVRESNPTGSDAEPSAAPGPVSAMAADASGVSRSGQDRSPSVRETSAARSKQRSSGRRRLTVGQRREELIDAALELFGERSPEDVSIDDVAARAGASRALVYHYFGGKHELYVAALRNAAKKLSVLLEPPTEGRPLDRMRRSLSRYFDFVEDHAAGFTA